MKRIFYWIMSVIGFAVIVWITIYQFSNPELTQTQITIYKMKFLPIAVLWAISCFVAKK